MRTKKHQCCDASWIASPRSIIVPEFGKCDSLHGKFFPNGLTTWSSTWDVCKCFCFSLPSQARNAAQLAPVPFLRSHHRLRFQIWSTCLRRSLCKLPHAKHIICSFLQAQSATQCSIVLFCDSDTVQCVSRYPRCPNKSFVSFCLQSKKAVSRLSHRLRFQTWSVAWKIVAQDYQKGSL